MRSVSTQFTCSPKTVSLPKVDPEDGLLSAHLLLALGAGQKGVGGVENQSQIPCQTLDPDTSGTETPIQLSQPCVQVADAVLLARGLQAFREAGMGVGYRLRMG